MKNEEDTVDATCVPPAELSEYEQYIGTEQLLNLQVTPDKMLHRDELLFQIVHQSTELWLKLSNNDMEAAITKLIDRNFTAATLLIQRSAFPIQLVTRQLDMFRYMTPHDFKILRPALGNGSGLQSPGWKKLQLLGNRMDQAFTQLVSEMNLSLLDIYTAENKPPLYFLMEAMIDWDENVSLWRNRHYKNAVRTLGLNTVGTQGMPIEKLTVLMNKQSFPSLWSLRTELTNQNSY